MHGYPLMVFKAVKVAMENPHPRASLQVAVVVEAVSEMLAALVETAMSVAVALEATATGEVEAAAPTEIAEEAMVADRVTATATTVVRRFPRVPLLLGLRLSRRSLLFLLSRIRRRSPKSPFPQSRLP